MFINHKFNLRYLEVVGAGSEEIKRALLETDGVDPNNFLWGEEAPPDFKPALVFTFVRHPFERLIDAYHAILPDTEFPQWVNQLLTSKPGDQSELLHTSSVWKSWQPQCNLLRLQGFSPDEVPFIGRLDNPTSDWKLLQLRFSSVVDLPQTPLGPTTVSQPCEFTCSSIRLAESFYLEDLIRFGYTTDAYKPRPTIEDWSQVSGPLSESEALALQSVVRDRNVLEIGTSNAKTSIAMAATASHILLVSHVHNGGVEGNDTWLNLVAAEATERVSLYTASVPSGLHLLELRKYGAVFYNTEPTEVAIRETLKQLAYRIDRNAVVMVYNYDNDPKHTGVKIAVQEFSTYMNREIEVVDRLAVLKPRK